MSESALAPPAPEPDERSALDRTADDVGAFMRRFLSITRRGLVPAIAGAVVISSVGLVLFAGLVLVFVLLAPMGLNAAAPSIQVLLVFLAYGAVAALSAFPLASPLAAFGIAARGETPTLQLVLARTVLRLPRLIILELTTFFLVVGDLVFLVVMVDLLGGPKSEPGQAVSLTCCFLPVLLTVVILHVRYVFLARVVLMADDAPRFLPAWTRVVSLTRGRFIVVLLLDTLPLAAPATAFAASLPSNWRVDVLGDVFGSPGIALLQVVSVFVAMLFRAALAATLRAHVERRDFGEAAEAALEK